MIFEKLRNVKSPERAHLRDSGIDFFIPDDLDPITIQPQERALIPLGIKVNIPLGSDMTFTNKSGIASKTGLIVGACLIDNEYRGELILNLINTSNEMVVITPWQKIVQGVLRTVQYFMPTEGQVSNTTERGEGWFWSTWLT